MAAEAGAADVVQFMIRHGAAVDVKDAFGLTVLHQAAWSSSRDTVEAVLKKSQGLLEERTIEGGATALMFAARDGHETAVGLLLEAKADINAEDDKGRTALCAACAYGHVDAARRLLQANADVNAADKTTGRTPLMRACQYGHVGVVEVMMHEAGPPLEEDRGRVLEYARGWRIDEESAKMVKLLDPASKGSLTLR